MKLYYEDKKIAFTCTELPTGSQDLDSYLNPQIKSYGNLVADKKKRAVMKLTEGKCAMTEEGFNQIVQKLIRYQPIANGNRTIN